EQSIGCRQIPLSLIADCGKAVDLCGGNWKGGRNGFLVLGARSAARGSASASLSPRSLLGVEFGLKSRARNRQNFSKCAFKSRVFALLVLGGRDGATWFLRHDIRSVRCRAPKVKFITDESCNLGNSARLNSLVGFKC